MHPQQPSAKTIFLAGSLVNKAAAAMTAVSCQSNAVGIGIFRILNFLFLFVLLRFTGTRSTGVCVRLWVNCGAVEIPAPVSTAYWGPYHILYAVYNIFVRAVQYCITPVYTDNI